MRLLGRPAIHTRASLEGPLALRSTRHRCATRSRSTCRTSTSRTSQQQHHSAGTHQIPTCRSHMTRPARRRLHQASLSHTAVGQSPAGSGATPVDPPAHVGGGVSSPPPELPHKVWRGCSLAPQDCLRPHGNLRIYSHRRRRQQHAVWPRTLGFLWKSTATTSDHGGAISPSPPSPPLRSLRKRYVRRVGHGG